MTVINHTVDNYQQTIRRGEINKIRSISEFSYPRNTHSLFSNEKFEREPIIDMNKDGYGFVGHDSSDPEV